MRTLLAPGSCSPPAADPAGDGPRHVPVMVREVLGLTAPRGAELAVDCTLGLGGHAEAFLRLPGFGGQVLGIDRDAAALERAERRLAGFGKRFRAVRGRFGDLGKLLEEAGCRVADVFLFDLGVSSLQLEDAPRGFSFRRPGPLDMRMDPSGGPTAADLVSELDEEELARVLWDFGEERLARRVAREIVRERTRGPIVTTDRLAEVVRRSVGRSGGTDPATRTFQALRIAVNDEMGELARGLRAASGRLAPGGRLAVLTFHSLEDRAVKRFMAQEAACGRAAVLTRKALTADRAEVDANPRARSAKLRAMRAAEAQGS